MTNRSVTKSATVTQPSFHLFWGALLLIALAEMLTVIRFQVGLIAHGILLCSLLIGSGIIRRESERKLTLALALAPLTRLLSMGMPLPLLPQLAWYPVVAIPLLIAAWTIIRQTGVKRRELGLRRGNLWLELALMGGGFTLGAIEYAILQPEPSFATMSLGFFVLFALSLLFFTGFSEELIFRGLLQTLVLPVLGRWGLVYVSLLFGVLHIGHLSFVDVIFVTLVGYLFAQIVYHGGSILGVTVAHGITNLTLFVIMPYVYRDLPEMAPLLVGVPVSIGTALFVGAIGFMILRAAGERILTTSQTAGAVEQADARRAFKAFFSHLRRNRELSYTDLAQRTGIPARELIAIELGLSKPQPEQLALIARELGVAPGMLTSALEVAHTMTP